MKLGMLLLASFQIFFFHSSINEVKFGYGIMWIYNHLVYFAQ